MEAHDVLMMEASVAAHLCPGIMDELLDMPVVPGGIFCIDFGAAEMWGKEKGQQSPLFTPDYQEKNSYYKIKESLRRQREAVKDGSANSRHSQIKVRLKLAWVAIGTSAPSRAASPNKDGYSP